MPKDSKCGLGIWQSISASREGRFRAQVVQCHLRGVCLPREHRLTEKYSPQRYPVESTYELVTVEDLDTLCVAHAVQSWYKPLRCRCLSKC